MSDMPEAPAPSPDSAKPRRGRPRKAGAESQQQRVERLQAELQRAQDALKLVEEKRASIVGAAAVRRARTDAEFRRALAAALRVEVKGKADLEVVGDLLVEKPDASSATAAA